MTEILRHRAKPRQVSDAPPVVQPSSRPAPDPPLPAAVASHPPPAALAPAPAFPDPIPDVLPFGSLTMFAGPPGAGKTTLLVDWIRRWLDGQPICGKPTHAPAAVGILIADRQAVGTKKWLEAVGIAERVKLYCIAEDNTFPISDLRVTTKVADIFHRCLDRLNLPPGAHLIVDPITPLFIIGDPNKQRDVALSMMHYSRVCQQRQLTMTCTGHFSKQTGKKEDRYARPQDRIAGSVSFVGFTDTQMYLLPPEGEQKHHELGWVPRHAREERFLFTRGEDGLFIPYDDAQALAEQQVHDNDACRVAMLEIVPEEPEMLAFVVVIRLIREKIGLSQRMVFYVRSVLIEQGLLLVPKYGYVSRPRMTPPGNTGPNTA